MIINNEKSLIFKAHLEGNVCVEKDATILK